MKLTQSPCLALLSFLLLSMVSCRDQEPAATEGNVYTVQARFDVDSTLSLDHMVLYADNHVALYNDSLTLSPDKTVSAERRTPAIDELYLCSDGGELCRFYAMGGMQVQLALSGRADSLVAVFDASGGDTVNVWLREQMLAFEPMEAKERRTRMDSLCHQMAGDVRCALLLREEIRNLDDSVCVRRCLGALTPEAKPEWLVQSIEDLLTATSSYMERSRRLAAAKFVVNDSTTYDQGTTRSDYLLIYCWADYDQASVDSLKVLADLLADEYDMKRLVLLSCCLGPADSAAWQKQVGDLEGMHVLVPAGLADKRVRDWRVNRVPTLILCDMYNNQQQRNVWGKTLRDALTRVPNRSGFAHTPKTKPHGR